MTTQLVIPLAFVLVLSRCNPTDQGRLNCEMFCYLKFPKGGDAAYHTEPCREAAGLMKMQMG